MLFSTSNQKDAPALSRFVARMLVTMSLTQLATPRDLLSEAAVVIAGVHRHHEVTGAGQLTLLSKRMGTRPSTWHLVTVTPDGLANLVLQRT